MCGKCTTPQKVTKGFITSMATTTSSTTGIPISSTRHYINIATTHNRKGTEEGKNNGVLPDREFPKSEEQSEYVNVDKKVQKRLQEKNRVPLPAYTDQKETISRTGTD